MDCSKTGQLLLALRNEKGMTQRQVADMLNISDKTVSKWERGLGCPDVSLLNEISGIYGVNISGILAGELDRSIINGGNMKRLSFYYCNSCKNVITASGKAEISCCGRKLMPLTAQKDSNTHTASVETVDTDFYIRFNHEMTKEHYISFVAYAGFDRMMLIKLYPEQDAEVRFPKMYGGKLYACCSKHGLFELQHGR